MNDRLCIVLTERLTPPLVRASGRWVSETLDNSLCNDLDCVPRILARDDASSSGCLAVPSHHPRDWDHRLRILQLRRGSEDLRAGTGEASGKGIPEPFRCDGSPWSAIGLRNR